MEFRLLGPVEVLEDGNDLPIGGGRQRALLAALLIRPNEIVSADRLIEELWGEHPPANPHNALQAIASRLRPCTSVVSRCSGPWASPVSTTTARRSFSIATAR